MEYVCSSDKSENAGHDEEEERSSAVEVDADASHTMKALIMEDGQRQGEM